VFVEIRKIVYRFFEIAPFRRIEAVVVKDFEPGCRFAESLGFQMEAPCLKGYFPGGIDAVLYART
jgi:RimJ/RimL family protein N-acetyltransferase